MKSYIISLRLTITETGTSIDSPILLDRRQVSSGPFQWFARRASRVLPCGIFTNPGGPCIDQYCGEGGDHPPLPSFSSNLSTSAAPSAIEDVCHW